MRQTRLGLLATSCVDRATFPTSQSLHFLKIQILWSTPRMVVQFSYKYAGRPHNNILACVPSLLSNSCLINYRSPVLRPFSVYGMAKLTLAHHEECKTLSSPQWKALASMTAPFWWQRKRNCINRLVNLSQSLALRRYHHSKYLCSVNFSWTDWIKRRFLWTKLASRPL